MHACVMVKSVLVALATLLQYRIEARKLDADGDDREQNICHYYVIMIEAHIKRSSYSDYLHSMQTQLYQGVIQTSVK